MFLERTLEVCLVNVVFLTTRTPRPAIGPTRNHTHKNPCTHTNMHTRTCTQPCCSVDGVIVTHRTHRRWLEHSDGCHRNNFYFIQVFEVRAIPTLSVILTSGEEVVPEIFVKADSSLQELAHAVDLLWPRRVAFCCHNLATAWRTRRSLLTATARTAT